MYEYPDPGSGKFLLVESEIWENLACGIWNPGFWNPVYRSMNSESPALTITIRNPTSIDKNRNPVPGIRNPRHGIQNQDCLELPQKPITLERATPILHLCRLYHGVLTDRFIFRHISEHYFSLKWNLRSVYKPIQSTRYQNRKLNVSQR